MRKSTDQSSTVCRNRLYGRECYYVLTKLMVSPSELCPKQALRVERFAYCPSPKGMAPAKLCRQQLPRDASFLTHSKLIHQGDIILSMWPEILPETANRSWKQESPKSPTQLAPVVQFWVLEILHKLSNCKKTQLSHLTRGGHRREVPGRAARAEKPACA